MSRPEAMAVILMLLVLVLAVAGIVVNREKAARQATIDQAFDQRCRRAGGAVVPGIEPGIVYCAQLVQKLEPK